MSKYLKFVEQGESLAILNKTKSKARVGIITFCSAWNQFVFEPAPDILFHDECLEDIIAKIKSMNKNRE